MTLTRARHKMPDYIRDALNERKPMDAYREKTGLSTERLYWLDYTRQAR